LKRWQLRNERLPPTIPPLRTRWPAWPGNYLKQERYDEAETLFRDCLAIRAKKESGKWQYFATLRGLGASLLAQEKYAEAEKHLIEGYQGLKQREDSIPKFDRRSITEALEQIVELYDDWGKPDEAARWRTELQNRKSNNSHQASSDANRQSDNKEQKKDP
jgi:hypothetical protein